MQHWDSGDRMEISSLECFPNLGGKVRLRWGNNKAESLSLKEERRLVVLVVFGFTLWRCPSAKGTLPHQIWKTFHSDVCPCYLWEQKSSQKIQAVKPEAFVYLILKGYSLLMRKSKMDMSMMLRSLFPELYGYISFTVSQKKGFTSHLQQKGEAVAVLGVYMCDYLKKKATVAKIASFFNGGWHVNRDSPTLVCQ